MDAVNQSGVGLDPDQLNDLDRWIVDFLTAHEWASPQLLRAMYNDEHDAVSRQWISSRVRRLHEHEHIEKVHPDAYDYRLVSDPRQSE